MSDPSLTTSADADPFSQQFTIIVGDGSTLTVSLADVDEYVNYGIRISINYASQIGASFVLLAVLLLLTRADRRASVIFGLNMTSLFLSGARNTLQCIYFSGPFYGFYAQFAGDFSRIHASQYGASIGGIVLTFLLLCCIQVSLVLQVRAVCVTLPRAQRTGALLLSAVMAIITVAFRFALMVTNSQAVVSLAPYDDFQWLAATNNYITMTSICFFSFVFVTKLGIALKQRRRLGLRQFGPMQIIFIMGCQTLIVPAIFSILESFTDVPELGSQTLTIVAIFLPLSAMWASAALGQAAMLASKQRGNSLGNAGNRRTGSGFGSGSGPVKQEHVGSAASNATSTVRSSVSEDADLAKKPFFSAFRGRSAGQPASASTVSHPPGHAEDMFGDLAQSYSSTVAQASSSPNRAPDVKHFERGEVRVNTVVGVTKEPRSV